MYGHIAFPDDKTVADVKQCISAVWEPCHNEYFQIQSEVVSGNISFESTQKAFGLLKSKEELERELAILCRGRSSLGETRLRQIEELRILHRYQNGAQIMLNVRQQFGLEGDFGKVEILAKVIYRMINP